MTARLAEEFEKRLKRGAVFLHREWQFGGEKHEKFFIVLNLDISEPAVFVVLTTSQQAYYKDNPLVEADVVRFEPERVTFFKTETLINCRDVWPISRDDIKQHYVSGTIGFVGNLPANELVRIDKTISESRQIDKRMKKKVCPPRS